MSSPKSPIGHSVREFQVVGIEHDGLERWIGADLILAVPPVGRFAVRILTKEAYLDENLAGSLLKIEEMDPADFGDTHDGSRPPYVLNDSVITYDVLIDKFAGRVIRPDLADSLFSVINHNEE